MEEARLHSPLRDAVIHASRRLCKTAARMNKRLVNCQLAGELGSGAIDDGEDFVIATGQ